MKVLIVGSGGREHAIAWKAAQNPDVEKIYCAPGNGGTAVLDKCINVNISKIDELLNFAIKEGIDLTIAGPEAPLVDGIADTFKAKGMKIFGPSKAAAQLEGSKALAKNFMKKYGVKTAEYEVFDNPDDALVYIKSCIFPVVIKADGLAAGKGVAICKDLKEAEDILNEFMVKDIFKGSGKKVVVEEYLEGVEATILSITDGKTIIPFISSKDHKAIYENNEGPNTGGMGVIAPNPWCTDEVLEQFEKDILKPTIEGIKCEGFDYTGIIYFGIMIAKNGVYLLEYNVRMGDPETQALLPLMKTDFIELISYAVDGKLDSINLEWIGGCSCCVVASSKGYPGEYASGFEISGIEDMESKVFIAGAKYESGRMVTSGGRVLSIVAVGKTIDEARNKAYRDIEKVKFEGMYYRKDIGRI